MSQKLATYGQWTYRGAWALEIAAATIGLATGIALGLQAFGANQSATAMDLTLASAPFIMVAIAELTKIPIATLLFSASWLWKPFLLMFLLLLAAITFETVFMGLERAGALRQLQYEELANKIDVLKAEAAELARADEAAGSVDEVAKARSELETISTAAASARKIQQTQIGEVDADLEATKVLSPDAARVRDQLLDKQEVRTTILAERDKEIATAVEQFERQRDSFVDRIRMARESDDNASAQRMEAELARLANPRRQIVEKYDAQIGPVDKQIAELRDNLDKLRASSPAMTADQRERLQSRRRDLEELLVSTSDDWQRQIDQARAALAAAQTASATEAATFAKNQVRRDQIAKEISELERQRVPLARTDQVRRIASRFFGKKPEEVTEWEEGLISVLWFGSLAAIAALAGPITAMVALGLQRIAAQAESKSETKFGRLVRLLLLKWRWKRVRTINVPVEVAVEKEIERRVEVPVEKIVKEILYIPLFTDEPEALRRALDQDLPADVVDLVKVSAKGRRRASAP